RVQNRRALPLLQAQGVFGRVRLELDRLDFDIVVFVSGRRPRHWAISKKTESVCGSGDHTSIPWAFSCYRIRALMAAPPLRLGEDRITLEALADVARRGRRVVLGDGARARMEIARREVDRIADGGDDAPRVYGVNTGFGALAEV